MRRLIMWNMVTLDGLFEGPRSWDIEWHTHGWGEELDRFSNEQLSTAGMLLFGRVTYQGMAEYWMNAKGETADYMNTLPKVVFSGTLERAEWNNTRLVSTDATETVKELKRQTGRDLFVFGSANLCTTLSRAGLFDEYRLALNPIVLGSGTPLFRNGTDTLKMRLLEARPLATGCVILRYSPVPSGTPGHRAV